MAATIMVQALDQNWDPIEGENGPVFLVDVDAVTQIIQTILKLLLAEWWEDLSIGFPFFQSTNTPAKGLALLIQQTVNSCPYVTQVSEIAFATNRPNRSTIFTGTATTPFGQIAFTNAPGTDATL